MNSSGDMTYKQGRLILDVADEQNDLGRERLAQLLDPEQLGQAEHPRAGTDLKKCVRSRERPNALFFAAGEPAC